MAIQAIPDSRSAYQGSVSGTERTNLSVEQTPVIIRSEAMSTENDEKTVSGQIQGATDKIGAGNEAGIPGTEALKKAAEVINSHLTNSEAIFGVHDRTNRITIKIVDKDTKEVLKEYPPEKTLDMIAKVWEMAGLMVDEKR